MSVKPIPKGYTRIDRVAVRRRRDGRDRPQGARNGAIIREPAQTFVTGDRFASILDPFDQRWTVMTRVEDVSPEERDRRMAEWAKENV